MSSSAIAAGLGPSPVRRDDGTYKVRPNDNFWSISEKLYGTGAYFKALAEANRDRSSRDDHLRVGRCFKLRRRKSWRRITLICARKAIIAGRRAGCGP